LPIPPAGEPRENFGHARAAASGFTRIHEVISLISKYLEQRESADMATLIVRNLDPRIVDALKQRAARHGRSAEAEHRELLRSALLRTPRRSLAEALAAMPNVGRDEDFERWEEADAERYGDSGSPPGD
jgi:plasmid stability protein